MNAVDYVLKPFDKARIAKAVQRAKKMIEAHTSPVERLEMLVGQLGCRSLPKPKSAQAGEAAGEIAAAHDPGRRRRHDLRLDRGRHHHHLSRKEFEGSSNYRTIEELAESLDSGSFLARRTAPIW